MQVEQGSTIRIVLKSCNPGLPKYSVIDIGRVRYVDGEYEVISVGVRHEHDSKMRALCAVALEGRNHETDVACRKV
jgi:hypothetical protein